MILQIVDGPETGRRIVLKEGHTLTLGRAEALERFEQDPRMSSLHFALSLRAGILRLQNLSKSKSTRVNGESVQSAELQAGDQVRAGETTFRVIAPSENPYPAKFRVGGWGFNEIPGGWNTVEGVGLAFGGETFQSTALAHEEFIEGGLSAYVDRQISAAKYQLKAPAIHGPLTASMEGSEEALLVVVESESPSAQVLVQEQIYARCGDVAGILTLTTLKDLARSMNQALIEIVRGANFHKPAAEI